MQAAIDLFRENIRRSRNLTSVFRALTAQTTTALDLTDILRSALVMSVSALDHFIHELVRLGILEAYRGERPGTPALLRFPITLEGILETSSGSNFEDFLDNEIRQRHGYQSFQTPDHIADAIRLISDVELWNEVARTLGMERKDVRDRLNLVVQRRNKIAHEADIMPDYARQTVYSDLRSPIDEALVADAITFIESVADAIYGLVSLASDTTPHE